MIIQFTLKYRKGLFDVDHLDTYACSRANRIVFEKPRSITQAYLNKFTKRIIPTAIYDSGKVEYTFFFYNTWQKAFWNTYSEKQIYESLRDTKYYDQIVFINTETGDQYKPGNQYIAGNVTVMPFMHIRDVYAGAVIRSDRHLVVNNDGKCLDYFTGDIVPFPKSYFYYGNIFQEISKTGLFVTEKNTVAEDVIFERVRHIREIPRGLFTLPLKEGLLTIG